MSDLYRKTYKTVFVGGSPTPVRGKPEYEHLSRREVLEALGAAWRCCEEHYYGELHGCTPDAPHQCIDCHWAVPAGGDE